MKKLLLGFVILITSSLFSFSDIQACDNPTNNEKEMIITSKCTGTPIVEVTDVQYNYKNGYVDSYTVKLKLTRDSKQYAKSYRVKVTPKDKITGAVVEAVQYVSINCGYYETTGTAEVTFNCRATKDGDPAYCASYDFIASIVE